jgi:hypothetical protein
MRPDEMRHIALNNHDDVIAYYTPDEVQELISDEKTSYLVRSRAPGWGFSMASVFIKIDGVTTKIGTADLYGQVHSSIGITSDLGFYMDPLKTYREKSRYGAVLIKPYSAANDCSDQCLFILNALTDG